MKRKYWHHSKETSKEGTRITEKSYNYHTTLLYIVLKQTKTTKETNYISYQNRPYQPTNPITKATKKQLISYSFNPLGLTKSIF